MILRMKVKTHLKKRIAILVASILNWGVRRSKNSAMRIYKRCIRIRAIILQEKSNIKKLNLLQFNAAINSRVSSHLYLKSQDNYRK